MLVEHKCIIYIDKFFINFSQLVIDHDRYFFSCHFENLDEVHGDGLFCKLFQKLGIIQNKALSILNPNA